MRRLLAFVLCAAMVAMLLPSCEIDSYEKGEGEYSLMTADFVEATIDRDRQVAQAVTDGGEHLTMIKPMTASWINKGDTTYRALLYYRALGNGAAEGVGLSRVAVLLPVPADSVKGAVKTDPLHLESIWMSKNGKYLNMRLRLLTGTPDDEDARHMIGLVADSTAATAHATLQLYHDRSGRPEYYSTTTYASLPMSIVKADTLTIRVNTYDGPVTHTFALR